MLSPKQSQEYSLAKKLGITIMWSLGLALLLGISSYVVPVGYREDPVERAIRSATTGMMLGLLYGAKSAGIIRDRKQAILVGLLGGVIAGLVYWATIPFVETTANGIKSLPLLLLLFSIAGLLAGAIFGLFHN